ncbi:MAG TPA: hypothetical protein VFC75_01455 [Erysipelothrix sp.]|nr:hypothetical protein [Erysipelothrix sp.]
MLRKLTEFLFEEEEIVIEEELTPKKEKEAVMIKPVEPLKDNTALKPKESKQPETNISNQDTIEFDLNKDKFEQLEKLEEQELRIKKEKRKSVMIDLEEEAVEPIIQKTKPKIYDTESPSQTYQRRSVLSPMHGGDAKDFIKEDQEVVAIRKQEPITKVISPMFGQINKDESQEDILHQDLMDLDLEAMIHEEENDDEVQTSLYDFLEGLENEDE